LPGGLRGKKPPNWPQKFWVGFATECIKDFVVYLNLVKASNQTQSATGEILTGKVLRIFISPCVGLASSRLRVLIRRQTCAPATTKLIPQLVGSP